VDAGPDGAAEMEEDDQPYQGDREDDPKHDPPPWPAAGGAAVGTPAGAVGALGGAGQICQERLLLSGPDGRRSAPPSYRDNLSLSNQSVSGLVAAYTSGVPKLWTETIEAHRREVRDAILDTTAALVAEHGLLAVTMSQIAAETGIGRATLYKYFPDVEAILLAWHDRQISAHLVHLAAVRGQAVGAAERLQAVLEAYALLSGDSRGHHDTDYRAFLHRDERVARAQHEVHTMLRDLLIEATKTGEVRDDVPPDELASYCLHALGGTSSQRSKAAVRRLVAVTLAGLRPRPDPS
jgi:AcrR family transcriptional regulator